MPRVEVNDITIHYNETGSGDNVLVLLHGHPFDCSMWRPQLQALSASGWRVIAPDLRGYGQSSVTPGKTTLDVFASDLAALLDQLGLHRVVLGGLSMGGQIVMEFCRVYPGRLRGILLAATTPSGDTDDGKRKRMAAAERVLREGMELYAEEVLPMMLGAGSIATLPRVVEHVRRMMRSTNPIGAAAALRGRAERPSYDDVLQRLDVPATVIVGGADAFTTRADAERMQALLQQSELIWLDAVGHMPNLEAETMFNEALERLLGRVASSTVPF